MGDKIIGAGAHCHERTDESIRTDTTTAAATIHAAAVASGTGSASTATAPAHLHAAGWSTAEEERLALGVGRLWLPHADHYYLRRHRDDQLPREAESY